MSTPPGYFEAMYGASTDPWDLAGRWYEHRKYALTLASLPRQHYRAGFEPGCSVGVLTRQLAARCDHLLATDRVASAVATADARNRDLPHVDVRRLTVPDQWPEGTFDLVVLSELLYYFDDTTLQNTLDQTVACLEPGGTLITVHWNHPVPEHVRTGPEVATAVAATPQLSLLTEVRDADFTLQTLLRRRGNHSAPRSPAQHEDLV
ncbi:SAM-dependent methyltransferase [Streptomyces angustmyceticus]|uniref:Methyltransferase n=1 Tax=Streptomyces angustmyceticus TaxID=285578 RepID=A0A5J4L480_9ACTN|nr:SAM-dependent methyltransferase [Streptomyces angustmyceticus]GES29257.1 methyltransferase [Streptomyces angustmyceticus]